MRNKVVLLFAVVLSVSCVRVREEQQPSYVSLEVTSSTHNTKTDITGSAVRYSADDAIFVQCEGYNSLVMSNSGTLDVEKFSGKYRAKDLSGTACTWYSVYPSTLLVTDEGTVSGTLPSTQAAPFDPVANIMYSDIVVADYDEDNPPELSFEMNQLMGLVRISFTNSDPEYEDDILQTVQLRTSTVLAGDFQTDVHAPSVAFTGNERKYVTSKYDTPVPLGMDQKHWVCLFVSPTIITGAKLIIRTDKHTFTYQSQKKFTPVSGTLTMLPLMDVADFSIGGPTTLKKRVACWGDSLTDASDIKSYTRFLQALLGDEWEVYNGGASGNRTYEIAARQGGLPLVTGAEFTLSAGTSAIFVDGVKRTHNVVGEAGYYDIRHFNAKLQNPCLLIGSNGEEVLCNITNSRSINGTDTTYTARISRLYPGEPVKIAEHTPIQTYAARELRDVDLTIIYMGTNGSFGSDHETQRYNYARLDNLADQHWEMINFTTHPESYLVLGIHWTPNWQQQYGYEDLFESEFGSRFLNLRVPVVKDEASCKYWLLYSGLYQDESEIPQSELTRAAKGLWPQTLMIDSMHPNDYGQRVFAKLIYDRMVELGYVD